MAIYLDDIKPLRLNKTQFFLPINMENKKNNSTIFLMTPNIESSIAMMRHPLALNRRLFESYYIEKDIAFVLNENRQLIRNDVSPIYENYDCISEITYAERKKLPNSAFGLPSERKYPMVDAHSVKSAIKLFYHCPPEKRGQLAQAISVRARKYKVKVDPKWDGWKYIDESAIQEANTIIPTATFYHGTDRKLDKLEPVSPTLGNKLEDAHWATYLWRDKAKAELFAIQKVCRNVIGDKDYKKPVYDIKTGKSFILDTQWEDIKKLIVGTTCYIYTIEVPVNKIGLGHSSLIPEFTTNETLLIKSTKKINITSNIFDKSFIKISKDKLDDYKSRLFDNPSSDRGLLKHIMYDQNELFEKEMIIKKGISKGEIQPGDNLNLILDNIGEDTILSEQVEEILVEDYTLTNEDTLITEDFVHTNYNNEQFKIFFGDSVQAILEEDSPSSRKYSNELRKLLYSERIKNQKECTLIHDRIKEELEFIKYTYINYALYKQKNLFIDWSYYTQTFFKNNIYKLDNAVDLFFMFVSKFLTDNRLDSAGYNVKTVFVPVNDWVQGDNVAWDYTKEINPISVIYRLLKRKSPLVKEKWGGYNFVFFSDKAYFKVNFNEFEDKDLPIFTTLIGQLKTGNIQDAELIPGDSPKAIVHKITDNLADGGVEITNLTGGTSKLSPEEIKKKLDIGSPDQVIGDKRPEEEILDEKKAKLVTQIKDTADKSTDEDNAIKNLDDDINSEWVKSLIVDLQSEEGPDINKARKARISRLRDDFANKKINNTPISELLRKNKDMTELETDTIPIDNINEEWKNVKFTTFSKNYNLDSDLYSIFTDLGTKSDPIMVLSIDKKDTSTSEDYIETWDIKFEDANGKRFSIKLDIPKFINNRYMKLRGNLKSISGQLLLLPIIKTGDDTAQIVSCSYNKIFIRRVNPSGGSKTTRSVSRLIKALKKYEGKNIKVYEGDNSFICEKYELPIEYRDLAGLYSKIELADGSYFLFNMDEAKKLNTVYTESDNSIPIYVNSKGKIETCLEEVAGYIAGRLSEDKEFDEIYQSIKPDKRLSYTEASILNTDIPVIVIMAYSEGLQTAMQKGGVKYNFVEKRPQSHIPYIKFSDGYITYDSSISSSLLMSGLAQCNTEDYSIKEINKKEMWLDFLDNFGGRIKADGLDNFYDLMFDPTTKEICELYHLPTDYVEALGYASNLLIDTKYNKHTDISGNRVRTNELIAGYAYKAIAKSYGEYKTQLKRNKKDASMTIKQSAVIDAILSDPTSKDLSVLNALLEAEANNEMSFKGLSGMNSDRSYSLDKRTYDKSMLGVIASSTGFAGNVGITRQATINSNVKGNRGIIVSPKDKDLNTLNMLCVTEALTPFGVTHDDPIRTAMAFIQTSKHQMRVKKSSPNLVTMGMDEALPYITSDIFSHKVKFQKAKVIEVTDNYLIYEENHTGPLATTPEGKPSRVYVDLRETVMKNSDGGFFVTVKLDPCVKKGDTLKYNDIVAYDQTSYSKAIGTSKSDNNVAYNIGTMCKLGVLITDEAFEDSAFFDNYISDALTSIYCVQKDRDLDKDTNVYNLVKKGQPIEEGDPLIVFQNAFEEKDANALLKSITDDDVEAISDLGRIHVRSKLTGWVQDIKIYRTCEIDELSPSLKKLVTEYEKEIQKTRKILKDNNINNIEHMLEPDYKLPATGKLKGLDKGVRIEFYIKCEDKFGIGDKLVYNSAIKGVGKDIIPEGEEPYTDFRPKEKINALLTVMSVNARMVTSIILNGALNKGLIELDRQCKELLGIEWKTLDKM